MATTSVVFVSACDSSRLLSPCGLSWCRRTDERYESRRCHNCRPRRRAEQFDDVGQVVSNQAGVGQFEAACEGSDRRTRSPRGPGRRRQPRLRSRSLTLPVAGKWDGAVLVMIHGGKHRSAAAPLGCDAQAHVWDAWPGGRAAERHIRSSYVFPSDEPAQTASRPHASGRSASPLCPTPAPTSLDLSAGRRTLSVAL